MIPRNSDSDIHITRANFFTRECGSLTVDLKKVEIEGRPQKAFLPSPSVPTALGSEIHFFETPRRSPKTHTLHSGQDGSAPSIISSEPLSDPRLTPSSVTAVNNICTHTGRRKKQKIPSIKGGRRQNNFLCEDLKASQTQKHD